MNSFLDILSDFSIQNIQISKRGGTYISTVVQRVPNESVITALHHKFDVQLKIQPERRNNGKHVILFSDMEPIDFLREKFEVEGYVYVLWDNLQECFFHYHCYEYGCFSFSRKIALNMEPDDVQDRVNEILSIVGLKMRKAGNEQRLSDCGFLRISDEGSKGRVLFKNNSGDVFELNSFYSTIFCDTKITIENVNELQFKIPLAILQK